MKDEFEDLPRRSPSPEQIEQLKRQEAEEIMALKRMEEALYGPEGGEPDADMANHPDQRVCAGGWTGGGAVPACVALWRVIRADAMRED